MVLLFRKRAIWLLVCLHFATDFVRGGARMKEQTYGWYPSASNVYEERRLGALTPYQLEALYRYRDSKYYAPAVIPAEEQIHKHRPSPSPSHRPGSTVSRSSKGSTSNIKLRAKSAPLHTHYKPPPKLQLPTPAQCWSTHVPETEITVPQPSPAPSLPMSSPKAPTWPTPEPEEEPKLVTTPITPPSQTRDKIVRIQSAKYRRDTPTKPHRPVKSAGPVRPPATYVNPEFQSTYPHPSTTVHDVSTDIQYQDIPVYTSNQIVWPEPSAFPQGYDRVTPDRPPSYRPSPQRSPAPSHRPSAPSPAAKPPSGKRTPLRPKAPSPNKMVYHTIDEDLRIEGTSTPDYNAEVKKHGWMLEIHGNPLNLKKVSKRLPYTVKCEEPEVERDPPRIHMENNETFFLNTIPRRPMAFAIDKEWISEVIHKKRMEMQEKHGLNYRYKNFSFVY